MGGWRAQALSIAAKVQSRDLTLVQMMGGSLAGHLGGEVWRVWGYSSRAGSGDISKKRHWYPTQGLSSRMATWSTGPCSQTCLQVTRLQICIFLLSPAH